MVELDLDVTGCLGDAPGVVFAWVMAGEVGRGDIGDCVGIDADDLRSLECSKRLHTWWTHLAFPLLVRRQWRWRHFSEHLSKRMFSLSLQLVLGHTSCNNSVIVRSFRGQFFAAWRAKIHCHAGTCLTRPQLAKNFLLHLHIHACRSDHTNAFEAYPESFTRLHLTI